MIALIWLCVPLPPLSALNLSKADLDGDGLVTAADLKALARNLNTLSAAWRGDVDEDGRISVHDLHTLARELISRVRSDSPPTDEDITALIAHVTEDDSAVDRQAVGRELARIINSHRIPANPATPDSFDGFPTDIPQPPV